MASEWLWLMVGSICAALAALQIIGTVFCFVLLHRNWRSVPELWGIDWLDIGFRCEQAFGVMLSAEDFENWTPDARIQLTAGQLWELVAAKLTQKGMEAPADGWQRVVIALSESLNVETFRITPASRLYGDLGMIHGLE